ncbi:MAG: hypothetical protein ABW220_00520 [Burkholderiaceae bacterium]
MNTRSLTFLISTCLLATGAAAQVPAAAPAGSTAVCKDGTFSGEAQSIACRNNKGIEQWWGVTSNMKPGDVPAAGDRGPYEKTLEPVPNTPAVGSATPQANAQGASPGASGDAGRVWVDPGTKLFRCAEAAKSEGKKPNDLTMTQAQARKQGYQSEHGKACPEK